MVEADTDDDGAISFDEFAAAAVPDRRVELKYVL